jgi:alpha-2-macroglobulin
MQNRALWVVLMSMTFLINMLAGEDDAGLRKKAQDTMQKGNYKDAFALFKKLALNPATDPKFAATDMQQGVQCLQNLGLVHETDDFRESVVTAQKSNWRVLFAAAQSVTNDQHYGYIVAGKFSRGHHRGGGEYVNSIERDRIRGLQLAKQALEASKNEPDKNALADLYFQFAHMLIYSSNGRDTWRLQYNSDLSTLPDYDRQNRFYRGGWGGNSKGAPVNDDGTPKFYSVGKDFDSSASDGERWRWALSMVAEMNPARASQVKMEYAQFLKTEFDVRTIQSYAGLFGRENDDKDAQDSIFALKTLGEDETIAKLASGVKRFKLPEEHNFIKMFRQIAETPGESYAESAYAQLATTFEDRQQYTKAAETWRKSIAATGDNAVKQQRLKQIVGNWGSFEQIGNQPANTEAKVEFRYRNASKVSFSATRINVKKLLDDVRAYIRSKPKNIDWQKSNVENIGYRLIEKNENQYLGALAAEWDLDLTPREGHFDRRVTVTTPLKQSGAYLVTAKLADGNTSRVIVWISDTAIVEKPTDKGALYYVADAVTGAPVAGAKLDLFGWRQEWNNNNPVIEVDEFALATDANGQVITARDSIKRGYQWMTVATSADGRMAFLGFRHLWFNNYTESLYHQSKAFFVTDRPVYRPNQPVKYKVWLGEPKYGVDQVSELAGQNFTVTVHNPRGEKIHEQSLQADEFGGIDGELTLDKEAPLGQYAINVVNMWPGSAFRLEEYKKPEFEVKVDAPDEPVMLGEKITAKVTAKYYFGAPVADAKVKYKVTRTKHTANWYPSGRWDWFYNTGYWWFGNDYDWYPGFAKWGCRRPIPWWWQGPREQPEIVLENEVPIAADGTVKVDIDTALAKAIHGDTDHKYEVSFDVTDQSRRTISGSGSVMVARQPFRVYTWVDRGHYRAGDTISADFSAQTLDHKPVKGKGTAKLLKVSYDNTGKPTETLVQEWPVETGENGKAELQIKAAGPGQFRLNCTITDSKNRSIDGAYIFAVIGEKTDAKDYRFNAVEITPDKREYKPGEKVKLLVNSNQPESTVLLFIRPSNNIYLPPKVLKMNGKSVVEEIEIAQKDMPNFFIEALTVHGARVHSEVREIVVPPESRVLNVDVATPKKELRPAEKAKIQVKVTDGTGEPYTGSLAVTVYDKSVEYISGGSNVPEIKAHFWKWRRNHYAQTQESLSIYSPNIAKSGEQQMTMLGAFGYATALNDDLIGANEAGGPGFGGGGRSRGGDLALRKSAAPGAPMAAAREMADGAANGMSVDRLEAKQEKAKDASGDPGSDEAPDVQPTVRKNFADTAFWSAKITATNGIAEIDVPMPESLTTWKVKVWSMGKGLRVGQGET